MADDIKIETGKPKNPGRPNEYWAPLMRKFKTTNDSFFVPGYTKHSLGYLWKLAKKLGYKISMTYDTVKGEDGVRVHCDGLPKSMRNSL